MDWHPVLRHIAITPDGNTAWVAGYGSGKVYPMMNLKTTPMLGAAVTGMTNPDPIGIAITPDGNTAWVADTRRRSLADHGPRRPVPRLGTAVTRG